MNQARVMRAAVLAMLIGAAVWVVAVPVAGVHLAVGSGANAQTVGLPSILVVGAVVAVAGSLSRRWFVRRARGVLEWNILAAAVLVLSLAGPMSAATSSARLVLVCLHLGVGLVVLLGQPRTGRPVPAAGVA